MTDRTDPPTNYAVIPCAISPTFLLALEEERQDMAAKYADATPPVIYGQLLLEGLVARRNRRTAKRKAETT